MRWGRDRQAKKQKKGGEAHGDLPACLQLVPGTQEPAEL